MSNIPCGAPNCPMTFTRACSRSQHVKACVYAKLSAQRKSAALRELFAPQTMRAPQPMRAIHEERVETLKPVLPYPSLRDAKVGQV